MSLRSDVSALYIANRNKDNLPQSKKDFIVNEVNKLRDGITTSELRTLFINILNEIPVYPTLRNELILYIQKINLRISQH